MCSGRRYVLGSVLQAQLVPLVRLHGQQLAREGCGCDAAPGSQTLQGCQLQKCFPTTAAAAIDAPLCDFCSRRLLQSGAAPLKPLAVIQGRMHQWLLFSSWRIRGRRPLCPCKWQWGPFAPAHWHAGCDATTLPGERGGGGGQGRLAGLHLQPHRARDQLLHARRVQLVRVVQQSVHSRLPEHTALLGGCGVGVGGAGGQQALSPHDALRQLLHTGLEGALQGVVLLPLCRLPIQGSVQVGYGPRGCLRRGLKLVAQQACQMLGDFPLPAVVIRDGVHDFDGVVGELQQVRQAPQLTLSALYTLNRCEVTLLICALDGGAGLLLLVQLACIHHFLDCAC
mmetsp:Transcript_15632/g.47154  ORF Transcript_15632/g.47154 Transcript_15632/m.47154 type:complete len:339 (-) Transcript_15632:1453-2469(-)